MLRKTKKTVRGKEEMLLEIVKKRVGEKKAGENAQHSEEDASSFAPEKKAAEAKAAAGEKAVTSAKSLKTPVDELYEIIKKTGGIRLDHAAKKFRIPESKVEEWAKILEESGLIEIHYSAIGKPVLAKKAGAHE